MVECLTTALPKTTARYPPLIGRERAKLLFRAFDAGVSKVESLIAEEGIDCNFKRVDKLKLAAKPEHFDKLARSQALCKRMRPRYVHVDSGTVA